MEKLLVTHGIKRVARIIKKISGYLENISVRLDATSLISSSTKKILQRNEVFRNKHAGQRAFVIVNGPSLKNQDIDILKDEITFVVSGFYKHPVIDKWQPTYYSILDKSFFDGSANSRDFFAELNLRICESIFFIPLFRGYKRNQEMHLLPDDKVFYVASAGGPSKHVDITKVVQSFESVSSFALNQAIYMGCSPIYLLGFDHDHLANRGFDKHFYEGATIPGNIRKTVPLSELYPYDGEMASFIRLWKNYRSLKEIAEKKSIKIYNATDGGYLDVFEKVRYEDIFK